MKKFIAASAVLAAGFFPNLSYAADTAELRVKGVIKLAACIPAFPSGGVVDYGVIPASSLAQGRYTTLAHKQIPFTITCDAALKMALKVSDNRANSIVSKISGDIPDDWIYGLGKVADKNVGSYLVYFPQASVTTDNAPANQIFSTNSGQSWESTASNGTGSGMLGKDRIFSWAAPGGRVPAAFKNISGQIGMDTFLNKPEALPLTQDVPLDGSATFEIIYV